VDAWPALAEAAWSSPEPSHAMPATAIG